MMPPERYCRECGGELEIRNLQRRRVRGLFGPRQWQADFLCKKCGTESGGGWSTFTASHRRSGPFRRLLFWLGLGRTIAAIRRSHLNRAWVRQDGRVDVAKLASAVPFPVYGLKGRPAGLYPRSIGTAMGGNPESITRVHLGYTRGHLLTPTACMSVSVGHVPRGSMEPFSEIHSILWNCSSREQREGWMRDGDFHREWNMEVWRRGRNEPAKLDLFGSVVEVDLTRWEDHDVAMARFSIGDVQITATAARFSPDELLLALGTLVDLRADREALDDHQRGHDEARAESMQRHSDR